MYTLFIDYNWVNRKIFSPLNAIFYIRYKKKSCVMIIFLFVFSFLGTVSPLVAAHKQICHQGTACPNTYHSSLPIPKVYKEYSRFVDERIHSFNPIHSLPEFIDLMRDPRTLISWWRFDLVAKYIYADHYIKGVQDVWARDLYAQHLRVWGGLQEWDGSRSSLDDYLNAFHATLDSIGANGFNASISRIRVDNRGFPCEGAHRIIAALTHHKPVTCYYDPNKYLNSACQATSIFFSDYTQYVQTGLDPVYLDAMALAYTRLKPSTRMLIVFCTQDMCEQKVLPAIRRVANSIAYKQVYLTPEIKEHILHIMHPALKTINRCLTHALTNYAALFLLEPHDMDSLSALPDILSETHPGICFNMITEHQKTKQCSELFFHAPSMHMPFKNVASRAYGPYANALLEFQNWCSKHDIDMHDFCVARNEDSLYGETDTLTLHHRNITVLPHDRPLTIRYITTPTSTHIIYHPTAHAYYDGMKWEVS